MTHRLLLGANPAHPLMSGYTGANRLDDPGVPGGELLPKPFRVTFLSAAVRRALDS